MRSTNGRWWLLPLPATHGPAYERMICWDHVRFVSCYPNIYFSFSDPVSALPLYRFAAWPLLLEEKHCLLVVQVGHCSNFSRVGCYAGKIRNSTGRGRQKRITRGTNIWQTGRPSIYLYRYRYTPDMTGEDGNAPGPFQTAYRTFCKGGIIPLVIGAYGETNDEFQDLLKVCARMAVARGDAVYNSPIFETEVKGGAYSVTLHLYRRALAGVIARGLSLHKRSRLHFVRGSREEAERVSEEARSHFETGRCSDGNGFSARHSRREYGYYEQFRGSRSGPERPYH